MKIIPWINEPEGGYKLSWQRISQKEKEGSEVYLISQDILVTHWIWNLCRFLEFRWWGGQKVVSIPFVIESLHNDQGWLQFFHSTGAQGYSILASTPGWKETEHQDHALVSCTVCPMPFKLQRIETIFIQAPFSTVQWPSPSAPVRVVLSWHDLL